GLRWRCGPSLPFRPGLSRAACSLAGTPGCQLLLRARGSALFCFGFAALRDSLSSPKRSALPTKHSFPVSPEKAERGLGSRCHLPLSARERAGQKKEIQTMYQNRISLIGFVGNEVQLKSTKNGTPVAVLSLATQSRWKNANGEYASRTEWH